jgi:hypothetical protein
MDLDSKPRRHTGRVDTAVMPESDIALDSFTIRQSETDSVILGYN